MTDCPYAPIAAGHLWHMGSRLCDLPGYMLDGIALIAATAHSRPVWLDQAQADLDAQHGEVVDHA